ncbi:hypothetical protein D3C75_1007290 [compost metagenome]
MGSDLRAFLDYAHAKVTTGCGGQLFEMASGCQTCRPTTHNHYIELHLVALHGIT